MTISASHAMNFSHLVAPQGRSTVGSATSAGKSDFDHILASTAGANSVKGTAGFDHTANSVGDPGNGKGVNHLASLALDPNAGEQTTEGTVSSSKNGDGTYSKTVEEVNGQKVVDMEVTYANGKTKDVEKTITMNADGSKTVTKTNANGKTSTIDVSKSRDANGNVTISRESTNANGKTTDSTISVSKSATGEVERDVTRTNAKGETETLDRMTSNSGGVRTVTTTGTGYDGSTIDNETTWTVTA